ncbi:MAG: HAD hydrolase-like protein [Spirochaetes bacterium]|nr:HAD hydrolase-like protein [Spirochaetota bacterium]
MKKSRLIVFDMDGVIVDVSKSYRAVVRETAVVFLKDSKNGSMLPGQPFLMDDLSRVKESGGLNNDWDLTYVTISLLLSAINRDINKDLKVYEFHKFDSTCLLLRSITENWDIRPLICFLKKNKNPLTALFKINGKRIDPVIRKLSTGEVGSGNLIKQIFQEIYLGEKIFFETYNSEPLFHKNKGLMDRETLIINTEILDSLSETGILAIATGRPKAEALYTLKRFGIEHYFSFVLTLDHCRAEEARILQTEKKKVSLSKPNPFMLDEIAKKTGGDIKKCFFIGDMPDDMKASEQSKYNYQGILFTGRDREEEPELPFAGDHRKKNGIYSITSLEELKKII